MDTCGDSILIVKRQKRVFHDLDIMSGRKREGCTLFAKHPST